MDKNLKLLYSSNEIKRFFKKILNLDFYDYSTMEYYVKKYFNEVTIEELRVMQETINNDKDNNSTIDALGSNNLNTIISIASIIVSVSIAIFVTFITYLLNNGQDVTENIAIIMKSILGFIIVYVCLLGVLFRNSIKKNQDIYKIQKIIRIAIAIKESNKVDC